MPEVRREAPGDFGAVRRLLERAFPTPTEADLVDKLRASEAHVPAICLVALEDDAVIGQITYSNARLDTGHPVLVLAPMAVVPERQGEGVGGALVRESLKRAADSHFPLVVVLGHADYYPRFGFEPAEALGIRCPFPVPAENWMAQRLPAYAPEVRGTLVYPPAFDEVA